MFTILFINGYKFNKPTQEDFDWLKENYENKLSDIEKHLGLTDETVGRMLKALDIERPRLYSNVLPNTEELKKELMNPYLSHVKIAEKYNVHETTVGHRRKALGISVRRNMSRTRLEESVAKALESLDYAYIEQKQIDKWSIDFYLGSKICIDIHGEWAHSFHPERDIRKNKWLFDKGYRYLVIKEKDVNNSENIIRGFMQGFPVL